MVLADDMINNNSEPKHGLSLSQRSIQTEVALDPYEYLDGGHRYRRPCYVDGLQDIPAEVRQKLVTKHPLGSHY